MAQSEGTFFGRFAAIERSWNSNIWVGFLLVLAGAISYPLFFARFPVKRDFS
jgi:hypothetical protein